MANSLPKRALALASLTACATWSLAASAQVRELKTTHEGYEVRFEDGDVLADGNGADGFVLRLRTSVPHVLLIRPRASFVPEMLKSVEDM